MTGFQLISVLVAAVSAVMLVRGLRRAKRRGRERRCRCGYEMVGVPGLLCPECGRSARTEAALWRWRRSEMIWATVPGLIVLMVSAGIWRAPYILGSRLIAPNLPSWSYIPLAYLGDTPTQALMRYGTQGKALSGFERYLLSRHVVWLFGQEAQGMSMFGMQPNIAMWDRNGSFRRGFMAAGPAMYVACGDQVDFIARRLVDQAKRSSGPRRDELLNALAEIAFHNVDPKILDELWEISLPMARAIAGRGSTVLIAQHRMSSAEYYRRTLMAAEALKDLENLSSDCVFADPNALGLLTAMIKGLPAEESTPDELAQAMCEVITRCPDMDMRDIAQWLLKRPESGVRILTDVLTKGRSEVQVAVLTWLRPIARPQELPEELIKVVHALGGQEQPKDVRTFAMVLLFDSVPTDPRSGELVRAAFSPGSSNTDGNRRWLLENGLLPLDGEAADALLNEMLSVDKPMSLQQSAAVGILNRYKKSPEAIAWVDRHLARLEPDLREKVIDFLRARRLEAGVWGLEVPEIPGGR